MNVLCFHVHVFRQKAKRQKQNLSMYMYAMVTQTRYSITLCMLCLLLPIIVHSCTDLEYPSNPGCIPTDPNQSPPPNCDMHQEMEAQCNSATGCSWTSGGVTGPWHSRNGIDNTCAVMVQHDYCTSHHFNTFGGVRVTSAEACCGCGGGSTFCGTGATRSVSGSDSICSCGVAYSGSDVTNGVATCVEKTCADSDGAGAAATCGSGASCSDGSVDDGYKCHCDAGFVGISTANGPATCVEQTCANFDGAGTAASCGSDATCSDNGVGDGYKCSCGTGFAGIAMPNSPASCVAVPTSGCIDLQYTSNNKCTASAAITNGAHQPNCDVAQNQNECKAQTLEAKNRGETGACNWTPGGQQEPWHERNGIGNTCAVMVQHDHCTSHYFNTFGGVQVTSAEACCGCGGGVEKTCADSDGAGAAATCGSGASCSDGSVDDGYTCDCDAGFVGTSTANGQVTCVEQSCADFDGAGTAASCGSGATCSDNGVGDGYKCSCDTGFTGIARANSPASCVDEKTIQHLNQTSDLNEEEQLMLNNLSGANRNKIQVGFACFLASIVTIYII